VRGPFKFPTDCFGGNESPPSKKWVGWQHAVGTKEGGSPKNCQKRKRMPPGKTRKTREARQDGHLKSTRNLKGLWHGGTNQEDRTEKVCCLYRKKVVQHCESNRGCGPKVPPAPGGGKEVGFTTAFRSFVCGQEKPSKKNCPEPFIGAPV